MVLQLLALIILLGLIGHYIKEQRHSETISQNSAKYVPAITSKNQPVELYNSNKYQTDTFLKIDRKISKDSHIMDFSDFKSCSSSSSVKQESAGTQISNTSINGLIEKIKEIRINQNRDRLSKIKTYLDEQHFKNIINPAVSNETGVTRFHDISCCSADKRNSVKSKQKKGLSFCSPLTRTPPLEPDTYYDEHYYEKIINSKIYQPYLDVTADRIKKSDKIKVTCTTFHLKHKLQLITTSTFIENQSEYTVDIKYKLTNNSGYFIIQNRKEDFIQLAPQCPQIIYIDVLPAKVGKFQEELTIDFGTFQLTKKVVFIVTEEVKVARLKLKKLPNADIPKDFRKCGKFHQTPKKVVKELASSKYSFLAVALHDQNYLHKMRHLIYLEELAINKQYLKFSNSNANFGFDGTNFWLEIPGIQKQKPTLALGDTIQASLHPSKIKHRGVIQRIEQDVVYVEFFGEFDQKDKKCRVEFFVNRKPFQRQQYALDMIHSAKGLGIEFLFPKINSVQNPQLDVELTANGNMIHNGELVRFYNNALNKCQKNAVMNVLRGDMRPLPYLIYGPPGTGKTRTVVECVNQVAKRIPSSKILVAAPSNTVANMITECLIESGIYKDGEFIRLVSFNQINNDLIPKKLEMYCSTIDVAIQKRKDSDKPIIESHKICISTLSTLGNLLQVGFSSSHQFTHVIIDEAGQSIEPETLIPISLLAKANAQVVLAGDPKQLGPVVISQIAKVYGYEKSLLERLSEHSYYSPIYGVSGNEYNSKFVTKLKENYRSLPPILHVYNHLFYNDELEPKIDENYSTESSIARIMEGILMNRDSPGKKCSAYFFNVTGNNQKVLNSTSWHNQEEAERVVKLVKQIQKTGIGMSSIGIITPYALQVQYLKDIFYKSVPKCNVQVSTVESFQGQERDIILVSTVRTNSSIDANSFISCAKRVNVTLSRARAVLVVFGKESLLSQDKYWRYYIQYTREMGTYVA